MPAKSNKNDPLSEYRQKRNFEKTKEPQGRAESSTATAIFVVQKHAASRLHYDFRLEIDGVLKSWAIPKGPSLNPKDKRLAVLTEDHPLAYADFEGTIPEPEYGAGTVIIWDKGNYTSLQADLALSAAFEAGHLEFRLDGEKLKGGFVLLKTNFQGKANNWLLIKKKDEQAVTDTDITIEKPRSVISQKTLEELAESSEHSS